MTRAKVPAGAAKPARSKSACVNPKCTCDPCTCAECHCGVARLGDLERRAIGILWKEPARERTVRDVADELPDHAYTTVATVLDRLVHKGLGARRIDGRVVRFRTTRGSSADHAAGAMHEALAASNDPTGALLGSSRFCRRQNPTPCTPHCERAPRETSSEVGAGGDWSIECPRA